MGWWWGALGRGGRPTPGLRMVTTPTRSISMPWVFTAEEEPGGK